MEDLACGADFKFKIAKKLGALLLCSPKIGHFDYLPRFMSLIIVPFMRSILVIRSSHSNLTE